MSLKNVWLGDWTEKMHPIFGAKAKVKWFAEKKGDVIPLLASWIRQSKQFPPSI